MTHFKITLPVIAMTMTITIQIILSFFLYNYNALQPLRNVGWMIWVFSAIFGWIPIFALRSKGKVPKGKSYVYTTVLVDTGIYAIIRHPQYLAGIMLSIALIFIVQHWIIALLGIANIIFFYKDIKEADKFGIKKFGDDYIRYMKRVPGINFFAGVLRLAKDKIKK